MRRALEQVKDGQPFAKRGRVQCYKLDLLAPASMQEHMETGAQDVLTPRGQAALAAPVSITPMQLQVLEWLEADYEILTTHINSFTACCRKGWVNEDGSDLSDAGTTALNNIRAASGSPEWKP